MKGQTTAPLIALVVWVIVGLAPIAVAAAPPDEIAAPVAPVNQLPDLPLLEAPRLKPAPIVPPKESAVEQKRKAIAPRSDLPADSSAWTKAKPNSTSAPTAVERGPQPSSISEPPKPKPRAPKPLPDLSKAPPALNEPAPATVEEPSEPIYRPLAAQVIEPSTAQYPTPNGTVLTPWLFPAAEPRPMVMSSDEAAGFAAEYYSDADEMGAFWSQAQWQLFPAGLLWHPPWANQREPRSAMRFSNARNESTIDTAIGGEFGLVRWRPDDEPYEGIQLDMMAVVFTRFNGRRLLTAADYRVGAPLTYAKGPWQAKLAYEHTSTHLGDEFIEVFGRRQTPHVRDEIVVGLARLLGQSLRVYVQAGVSFTTSTIVGEHRDRYDLGVEWAPCRSTTIHGQPFAAFDCEFRSDQDYFRNLTALVGWQWRTQGTRRGARVGVEFYNGRSPYGQFFLDNEDWVALALLYDW